MKGPTTLYLDRDKVERLKKLNVSVSEICNIAFGIVLDGMVMDRKTVVFELHKLRQRMIVAEIAAHELDLKHLTAMLDMDTEEFGKAKTEYDEMQRSSTIANIMRAVNDMIIENEFRIEESWEKCKEMVKQLEEMNYRIDFEWFKSHVNRLARWM